MDLYTPTNSSSFITTTTNHNHSSSSSLLKWLFTDWLWAESFWLPRGYYWNEINSNHPYKSADNKKIDTQSKMLEKNENRTFSSLTSDESSPTMMRPEALDLFKYSFLLALVFVMLRQILERYIFDPIGRNLYGIVDKPPRRAAPNPILEAHYATSRSHKHVTNANALMLSKQTDMTEREIQSWFRTKRGEKKPTKLTKFRESSWRFSLRFSILVLDWVVMWNKTWLRKSALVFEDYPMAPLDNDIRILYIVQFAFYLSLLMTLFHDVRRADFKEELLHHLVTLLLILLSWCLNQVRIGSLVMLDMDPCDVLLEIAKLATYMSYQRVADTVFVIFAALWVFTRIFLYLYVIIYNSLVMPLYYVAMFPGFVVFNALLGIIFILQLYWFTLIVQVAVLALRSGKVEDVRSDDEEDSASTGSNESLAVANGGGNGDNNNNKKLSPSNVVANGGNSSDGIMQKKVAVNGGGGGAEQLVNRRNNKGPAASERAVLNKNNMPDGLDADGLHHHSS